MNTYRWFVGIDWASQAHWVCILDALGRLVAEFEVAHTHAGLLALVERLAALSGGDLSQVAVAIEVPRGALVESLVERGAHVHAINPKQLDRFRDRYSPAGAKDDSRDAFVLGDSLRTDAHCFRRAEPEAPEIIELRETGRIDEELGEELGRLANRLREQLNRYWPEVLALCPAADKPWLWALLRRAPEPEAAQRLTRAGAAAVLKAKQIRRLSPEQVLAAWRTPALPVAAGTVEAASAHVRLLVTQLETTHGLWQANQARLRALLKGMETSPTQPGDTPADAAILRSLPGVGLRVAGALLGEAGQALARRDYQALRNHAGLAPITRQSGKSRRVMMRRACNKRLRNALYHWARVSAQRDPHSRQRYAALRAKGHSHARALRSLADRLLAQLMAMLRHGCPYEPDRARRAPAGAVAG